MKTKLHTDSICNSTTEPACAPTPAFARVALLASAVWLAAPLAGCGGGGAAAGDAPAAPPAPAAAPAPAPSPGVLSEGNYLVAGTTVSESGAETVVVADATDAARIAAVLSVPVQTKPPLLSTLAYTDQGAAGTAMIHGSPMTFFVNGGKLWQIDLAKSRAPSSVNISSLTDACRPLMAAPLDSTGLDAWVLVSTAGADGDCQTAADNRQAFVRSGTPPTGAPTVVPATTQVQPLYLSGDGGALWWMLAVDNAGPEPRLTAYGPALNVVEVAGSSGIRELNAQGHGARAGEGTFVRTGNALRRIAASATALSIGEPQLTFGGASWLTIYDRAGMYFTDNEVLYRVEGTAPATPLARGDAGSASTLLLAQSPTRLVMLQEDGSGRLAVSAVDKQTGAVAPLLAQPGDGSNSVWSVRGETLYYFTGRPGVAGALRRVELDGSGDTQMVTNLLVVGRVSAREWGAKGQTTAIGGTAALLACQPLPGSGDCRGSTLLQVDLATRAITVLGSFAGSSAPAWLAQGNAAYEGVKGAMIEVHTSTAASPGVFTRKDLYVFNPGEANSLKQLSPTTP